MEESKKQIVSDDSMDLNQLISKLPDLLKATVDILQSNEEKLIGVYSVTTIAGSLMPEAWINYKDRKNYPALMMMAVFPPAGGKGCISLYTKLLDVVNKKQGEDNSRKLAEYHIKLAEYKKGEISDAKELPQKPKLKVLLVPGNITSSKFTEQLAENNGEEMVLMIETEADAYGLMANRSEHSIMNSVLLRKAYQHEPISQMRRANNEHLIIEKPKLAIIFAGTPSQVSKIFRGNDDGLLSRFLFVKGSTLTDWEDVKPKGNGSSLDDQFSQLAGSFYQLWCFFSKKNIEVVFSDAQWEVINDFGKQKSQECQEYLGENAASIAKRHANMMARMAAILTMVRYYERKDTADQIECVDNDMEIAKWLVEESFQSSVELFSALPGEVEESGNGSDMNQLYTALPDTFSMKDIKKIGNNLGLKERTIYRYLGGLKKNNKIKKVGKGNYEKISDVKTSNKENLIESNQKVK